MEPSDLSPEYWDFLATLRPEMRQFLLDAHEREKTAYALNHEMAEREKLLAEMRRGGMAFTNTDPNVVEYFSFDPLRGLIQRGYK